MNRHLTKEDTWTANRTWKRCSTSLVIRKMCMKTTVRYHYIPVKVAKVKKTELWMVGEDVD